MQQKKIFKNANAMSAKQVGLKYGYRSGLEEKIQKQLLDNGIDPKYETLKLNYIVNKVCTYTPDFPVTKGIIIETKGRWEQSDRMKMKLIKEQYPDLDIRFIFTNSKARILKTSKTTYGEWCDKMGFKYADKTIPKEWLEEIKGDK